MEDGQQSLLSCATQASLTPWQHPGQAVGSKRLSIPKPGPGSGPGACPPRQTQWLNLVWRRPHGVAIVGGSVDTEGALVLSAGRRKMVSGPGPREVTVPTAALSYLQSLQEFTAAAVSEGRFRQGVWVSVLASVRGALPWGSVLGVPIALVTRPVRRRRLARRPGNVTLNG